MNDETQADQGQLTSEGASGSPDSALSKARSYLQRAEAWLLQQTTLAPGPEHATAAAAIGAGYAVLAESEAHASQRFEVERRARAAAVPRSYDGEAPRWEAGRG